MQNRMVHVLVCLHIVPSVCMQRSPWVLHEQSVYDSIETPCYGISTALHDLGVFITNLFSADAWWVLGAGAPFYGVAHMFDERVHNHFYCHHHHINKHQGGSHLQDMSECLVAMSISSLVASSFAVQWPDLQRTAQMYAITLPITWGTKSLIKKIRWRDNCRPKNQGFAQHKHYYGGFPSGHMLEMTYATIFFGLRMGPAFAIPLGIATTVIGAAFVQCNRHYVSQLVAGAALGAMFACAAYWTIESCSEQLPIAITIQPNTEHKHMALCAAYSF